MATRATYYIESPLGQATFYIHWDGYPEGAAFYFWNMHHHVGEQGSYADAFHRANDQAEITGNRDTHGDTEYHYELLRCGSLRMMAKNRDRQWHTLGLWKHYSEFINEYGGPMIENFEAIHAVPGYYGRTEYMTASQLRARAQQAAKKAGDYAAKFPQFTGNIQSLAQEAQRLACELERIEAAQ